MTIFINFFKGKLDRIGKTRSIILYGEVTKQLKRSRGKPAFFAVSNKSRQKFYRGNITRFAVQGRVSSAIQRGKSVVAGYTFVFVGCHQRNVGKELREQDLVVVVRSGDRVRTGHRSDCWHSRCWICKEKNYFIDFYPSKRVSQTRAFTKLHQSLCSKGRVNNQKVQC